MACPLGRLRLMVRFPASWAVVAPLLLVSVSTGPAVSNPSRGVGWVNEAVDKLEHIVESQRFCLTRSEIPFD